MKEKNRLGELPDGYIEMLAKIRNGKDEGGVNKQTLFNWAGDNLFRLNQLKADLEHPISRPEPSGWETNPITPTSDGTGLPRQGKTPRGLRTKE